MLGNLLLYAANRATQGAVDSITRKASWGGFAVFSMLVGIIFGLIVVFWALEPRYGAIASGLFIAIGCFGVGIISMMIPQFLDWLEKKAKSAAAEPESTVAAVKDEVAEAVDYFGPLRVMGSAFMLGLGIARSLKR